MLKFKTKHSIKNKIIIHSILTILKKNKTSFHSILTIFKWKKKILNILNQSFIQIEFNILLNPKIISHFLLINKKNIIYLFKNVRSIKW